MLGLESGQRSRAQIPVLGGGRLWTIEVWRSSGGVDDEMSVDSWGRSISAKQMSPTTKVYITRVRQMYVLHFVSKFLETKWRIRCFLDVTEDTKWRIRRFSDVTQETKWRI